MMTRKEHELIMQMFTRTYEQIGILTQALKSRGVFVGDDVEAFSHATHFDDLQIDEIAAQARDDYVKCAQICGVAWPED